jgi:ABC-type sugar transport system ATPase subunit
MTGISKRFGATIALADVSLEVQSGQVVALIGENGAGKSTLMKILAGAERADAGAMEIGGERYAPSGPHAARGAGVAMIYQELNVAPDLSVEDNVMLGRESSRLGILKRQAQRPRVRRALELLGHADLRPETIVRRLGPAGQQLVEIARAIAHEARLIVFDEPTSSLVRGDVEKLFGVIRRLKGAGIGIVYISHFLEEIREVADRYCVLRDGRAVGGGAMNEITDAQIVTLMVGRTVDDLFPKVPHTPSETLLTVTDLSGEKAPNGVSLALRRGEVLGIAGLMGAGRTELLRAIYALDPVRRGTIRVTHYTPAASPQARIRAGLGYVSEDRKAEGLAQICSIADNATYSRLAPYQRFGWVNLRRRKRAVAEWMQRLNVKARNSEQTVAELSGGNQQKVAILRVLHQQAEVLLLDEPTRGIDVATKAEVYRLIGEAAAEGKAVIFVSSYLPELMATCDRLGVMSRGKLVALRPIEDWTTSAVMACAIGGDEGT